MHNCTGCVVKTNQCVAEKICLPCNIVYTKHFSFNLVNLINDRPSAEESGGIPSGLYNRRYFGRDHHHHSFYGSGVLCGTLCAWNERTI